MLFVKWDEERCVVKRELPEDPRDETKRRKRRKEGRKEGSGEGENEKKTSNAGHGIAQWRRQSCAGGVRWGECAWLAAGGWEQSNKQQEQMMYDPLLELNSK